MQGAEVESALTEEDHGEDDQHETHENEEHADEHAEDAEHNEFHARYHFQCGQPERLEYIDVKLFEHFPGTNELEVQTISPSGQGRP